MARHFLGGISEAVPFAWPDTIDFLDSEDFSGLEASKNPIRRALAGQHLQSEIALMERGEAGQALYMRISSAIVADVMSPVRCVVVMDDVTEAEKNRQQIERTGRLEALGQLTGGIAHDFNNLLATIEYALELSAASGVNDKAAGYLKTATTSVRRGSALTARLLSFARQQPGRARSHKVTEMLVDFRALIEPSIEKSIELCFEQVDPSLHVYCDDAQLQDALLNLVLNSRDAIRDHGQGSRITVSVRGVVQPLIDAEGDSAAASGHYIEFAVADDGPGMGIEVQRRALDPFFTTKMPHSGTGLGLSMVYGFVRNAGGTIRIYSEAGHGTVVRLLLPSGTADGEREGETAALPVYRGEGQRVLIVEDDAQLRLIMADLVDALGYDVQLAASGQEALQLFDDGFEYDVMLTDIVMPGGIGGFELGEQVRDLRPDLPIVYMSGYTGFTEAEMGTAIGPFVQKPCAPSELSKVLFEITK